MHLRIAAMYNGMLAALANINYFFINKVHHSHAVLNINGEI